MPQSDEPKARSADGTLWRSAEVTLVAREDGQRADATPEFDIALSSEAPVERMDWFGERWVEVLSHDASAIDMSRAERGLPFLFDHDSRRVAGRIENVRRGDDGKLRGRVRFSSSADAQQLARDMADCIRPDISVGYRVLEWNIQQRQDTPDLYTATRWMPYEGSSVAIPADITVGIGRTATEPVARPAVRSGPETPAEPAEERTMSQQDNAPAVTVGDSAGERARVDEIMALAERHGVAMGEARQWIGEGKSPADVWKALAARKAAQERETPAPRVDATPVVLSEREEKEYSVAAAIASIMHGKRDGFAFEISDEIGRRLGTSARSHTSLFVPYSMQVRNLVAGTASKGGNAVFTEYGGFIDLLRTRSKVLSMGATFLSGLSSNVQFVRQSAAGTFSWEAEGTNAASSSLSMDTVSLTPRAGQSHSLISRQLLAQSTPDIENLVRNDLLAIHAIGVDQAALRGTGTGQPRGILNTAGRNTLAAGANGGAITWDIAVNLETEVTSDDADIGAMGYLFTPGVVGRGKRQQKFNTTTGMPLFDGDQLNGYRYDRTTNLRSTLTKGTASGICHEAVFGVWSQLVIGSFGPGAEIMVDPYSVGPAFLKLTSYQLVDVAVRQPAAFTTIDDLRVDI